MKRAVREFLEQEEATLAARSREARREHRRRVSARFAKWIVAKAEKMEANGNPAGAEQYRNFWRRFPEFARLFPAPVVKPEKEKTS